LLKMGWHKLRAEEEVWYIYLNKNYTIPVKIT
jgi:hypothetical protein